MTIIVPERVDSVLTRYASRSYFDDLLDAGVEIFLYRRGLLHTKSIVVDRRHSMFGSVNLDMRSLWIVRINAAARHNGLSYNRLINGLKRAGCAVNRKMLAELAVEDARKKMQAEERKRRAKEQYYASIQDKYSASTLPTIMENDARRKEKEKQDR